MHVRLLGDDRLQIETFLSVEEVRNLTLPALAEVRFADACEGMSPRVVGRLIKAPEVEGEQEVDPTQVRMEIHIQFDELSPLAAYFNSAEGLLILDSIPSQKRGRVTLGRLVGVHVG